MPAPKGSLKNAVMVAGLAASFIIGFENIKTVPYYDSGHVATVCVGHVQGIDIKKIYTKPECYKFLDEDTLTAARAVDRLVDVPLNENQKVALISFVFNIGEGAFAKSTMRKMLNTGQYQLAAAQFKRWNKVDGEVLRGLTRRRAAERDLFLKPVTDKPEGVNVA